MKKEILVVLIIVLISVSCKKKNDASSNELTDITSIDVFNEKKDNGVSLMFYHATWCAVCKEQRPLIEEAARLESLKNVYFGQVNFEDSQDIRTASGVTGFPTILIFDNGVEKERLTGKDHTASKLETLLKKYL